VRLEEIRLHNFGWFKDETIVLTGIQSAVVRGMNGTGKSTGFIDAPLAALFGHCRANLDELLYPGADEMSLSLTFQLNSQRYRVIRKRSLKTKAGKSDLELQLQTGPEWISVSGARIAETQQKIIDLLGADYELFTSTCFFLQGKADQFTQATPSERKSILAQILRLEQYALLKQAATRHLTIADARHGEKAGQLTALDETASTVTSLGARQAEVTVALDDAQKAIEQLEQHQQELTAKKATVAAEIEQLQAIPQQIAELQTQQSSVLKDHATKTTRRERAAKILENRATIEAKVLEEDAQRKQQTHLELEARGLQTDLDNVVTELERVNVQLLAGGQLRIAVDQAERRTGDLVSAYQRETTRMQEEIGREEQQVQLLTQVPCGVDLQKICRFTVNAVQTQATLPNKRQLYANRWGTSAAILEQVYPQELKTLTESRETLAAWVAKEWENIHVTLVERRTALLTTQKGLTQQRDTIKLSLLELAKFTSLVPELAAAEREVESVDQDLGKIMETLHDIDHTLERLQTRQADRARLTTEQERLAADWQQDANYMVRLRTDGQTAIGRLKELELEIKQAQESGRQAAQLRQECERLQIDGRHFQALATAYAQIPVLILESSIPLLEEQANRILEKISTTGMRIRIDTQKALKSRDGLAETLDIVVRDFRGERRYELYSGAEQFKVDLAIRIGLSRLLASRAGARLETIVIDEGFGCLDSEGIMQLRESLGRLSEDIGLLLVITHVDALKDSFPSQLVVTSDASGSHVDLIA
jgi:exonuclease SbcC